MMNLGRQMCAALEAHLNGGRAMPPEAGRLLWDAFRALSRTRSYHSAGPNPISYAEIRAWCELMQVPLQPQHVEIIMAMDAAWIADFHNTRLMADGVKRLPQQSGHALTPALFDLVAG